MTRLLGACDAERDPSTLPYTFSVHVAVRLCSSAGAWSAAEDGPAPSRQERSSERQQLQRGFSGLEICVTGLEAGSSVAVTPSPQTASGLAHSASANSSRAGTPGGWHPSSTWGMTSGACVPPAEQHGAAAVPGCTAADAAACGARGAPEDEGVEGQPHDRGGSGAHADGSRGGAVGAVVLDEAEGSTVPWPARLHDCLRVRPALTSRCGGGRLLQPDCDAWPGPWSQPAGGQAAQEHLRVQGRRHALLPTAAAVGQLHRAVHACSAAEACWARTRMRRAVADSGLSCAGRAHDRVPEGARHRSPRPRRHRCVRHGRRHRLSARRRGRGSAAVAAPAQGRPCVCARAARPAAVRVMRPRVRVQPRPRVLARVRDHCRGV